MKKDLPYVVECHINEKLFAIHLGLAIMIFSLIYIISYEICYYLIPRYLITDSYAFILAWMIWLFFLGFLTVGVEVAEYYQLQTVLWQRNGKTIREYCVNQLQLRKGFYGYY